MLETYQFKKVNTAKKIMYYYYALCVTHFAKLE